MRTISACFSVAMLLAAALAGQQAATFHLPAGDHRVDQLIARCEQAVKAPIALVDLAGVDERRPVHLQCDLALPVGAWEDALGSMLVANGLILTFDAAARRHEVLAAPTARTTPPWLAPRARAFTANEFLARPSHQGPVRVAVPGGAKMFALASAMLGPLAVGLPGGLKVEQRGDDVLLVGLGAAVRSGLVALAAADPALAASLPKPAPAPWPRASRATTESLPAGVRTLAEVVDCLARATGRNLLVDAAVAPELRFEVAATVGGDADRVEAALTGLLWQQHVVVLGLAPAHGIFVVQQVTPQQRPAAGLAQWMSGDEVLAQQDLVAYVQLVYQPRHVGLDQLVPAALAVLRAGVGPLSTCDAVGLPDGLLLRGRTSELRPVLERLRDLDRAP